MEYVMRRFKQMLPDDENISILKRASSGVLSLTDPDGMPYGVPMSFVFDGKNAIYLHSAQAGRKIDCIKAYDSCSFCIIDKDDVSPEEFTTHYRSVIVSGKAITVGTEQEKRYGLHLLAAKYSPGIPDDKEIETGIGRSAVIRIDIEHITGKRAKELVHKG